MYLESCANLEVPENELFNTIDLYEAKHMNKVLPTAISTRSA